MNGELTIRKAEMADLPVIADIFSRSFRTLDFLPEQHSTDEDFAHWRDVVLANQQVIVAEAEQGILGVMALDPGWIRHLYVDPARAGQGVGSALLKHAQSIMDDVQLWCFQDNWPARKFYEAHGFAAEEETDGTGNDEQSPDLRYRWRRGHPES